MSKNSTYVGPTQSLSIENKNLDNIVFLPSKPVLDSELNLISDLSSGKLQDYIRSNIPSGWLDANYSRGYDSSANDFGINTTSEANTFYVNSKKYVPTLANVNGWILQIGGTNTTYSEKLKITLSAAPSIGSREDLVFLEVFKRQISATPSTAGKPSATQIYKYGNTQYGDVNLAEEIINPSVGFITADRVQIQYRIRVVSGVNFTNYPEGLDDTSAVFAQGGNSSITSYTFTSAYKTNSDSFYDAGLYISGDGSSTAISELNTVDGYVYAIPMFRIHRRNQANFSVTNQNGAGQTLGNTSDRPDGLFFDQIHLWDIEDLRHAVGNINYQSILEENLENLFTGTMSTCLTESDLDNNIARTDEGFYINSISVSGQSNIRNICQPNGQLRYFSDVAKQKMVYKTYTTGDKAVGVSGSNWTISDEIQIEVAALSPTGTLIGSATPSVYANINNVVTVINGSWTNLGTSNVATFSLSTNTTLTNEDLHVGYQVSYPQKGYRLTKPLTDILKVHETSNNNLWGWVSVNAASPNFRRERSLVNTRTTNGYSDYAYDYKIGSKNGALTIVSYFVDGNGTQTYTLPGSIIESQDLLYVYSAYDVSGSGGYLNISTVRDPSSFSITVTTPISFSTGQTIRFDLVVSGSVLEYDERTQTIEDMGKVALYEIMGNNTDTVILENSLTATGDPQDIVLGYQGSYVGSGFSTKCYIDNYLNSCTVTLVENSNLVQIKFTAPISNASKISIALLSYRTLKTTETLNIYYQYQEYKGITKKANVGTSLTDYVISNIVYNPNKMMIVTNGTGAINTSETLSKYYEPLIPKLPKIDSFDDGDFTGTVHNNITILGGSYSGTSYNSPYTTGVHNYLTNHDVSQERGTYNGGRFTTIGEQGFSGINKLIVSPLLESIVYDGTKNFRPGELALRLETNCLSNTSLNQISNYTSGVMSNSYDLFKVIGRPLVKINK